MELQNFEQKDQEIKRRFKNILAEKGEIKKRINFSYTNWVFGIENLKDSIKRLKKYNVHYVELHGNRYGKDIGYNTCEVKKILDDYDARVSGICGMVDSESELSSKSPFVRQRCIDYFRRNIDLGKELNAEYILFSPGAVGRTVKYDDYEFHRAVETLQILGDYFLESGVKGAIEPVASSIVSVCHNFECAKKMIDAIDHEGVKHIAGDVCHMLVGEEHIGETILNYGNYLINLHMADTNRGVLGSGMLNLDIVIMALYLIGYNEKNGFCTAEPLQQNADPYIQRNGRSDPKILDELVNKMATYFYKREDEILKNK
jgi:D-psicose/D-tagatose/L-ribulose 3-epimerase